MKDKVIEVLGLGPSIQEYEPAGNEAIGVNDIYRYHPADRLLLMDPPESFARHRLKTIEGSRPVATYSHLPAWNFMPGFTLIGVAAPEHGGYVNSLDDFYCLPRHVDSTFTAVCLAYHFQASDIVMYGVDFTDYHLVHYKDRIIQSYNRLHAALMQRGTLLWLGSDQGILADFIPNWHKTLEVI